MKSKTHRIQVENYYSVHILFCLPALLLSSYRQNPSSAPVPHVCLKSQLDFLENCWDIHTVQGNLNFIKENYCAVVSGEILDQELLIGFLNFRISNFGISEYNIIFLPEYLKIFCVKK